MRPNYEEAYDVIMKSFAPVAVFDKAYDALGPYPKPPVLKAGEPVHRSLVIYNDTFADDRVLVQWRATQGDQRIGGEDRRLQIPLGDHMLWDITFTPHIPGPLRLELISSKGGREQFRDMRPFLVE